VAGSTKRRLSDEASTSNKKAKQEPDSPTTKSGHIPRPDASEAVLADAEPLQRPEEIKETAKGILTNGSYASPPELQADQPLATKVNTEATTATAPATTLVSPPTSLADDVDASLDQAEGEMRPSIEGGHEGEQPAALPTQTSTSRHSSRQPRQVDRYVPEVVSTNRGPKSAPKSSSSHHHPHHSHPSTKLAGVAVEAKSTSSTKKPSSRPTSSHHNQHSSPTMPNGKKTSPTTTTFDRGGEHDRMIPSSVSAHHHSGKAMGREGGNVTAGEEEEDMESLKLIRELHEQDFGLRRRGGRS
jgi:F-box/leucine-rich repeat protein 10/11